jgi:hypothetical protein
MKGETRVTHSGGAGGYALTINPELEPITRQIMAAMGGRQPSEHEWEFLFPNPMRRSGNFGSIDGALADQMRVAYSLAQQGYRKVPA